MQGIFDPQHINENASTYYIWALSIFVDINVCGFSSADIYSTVIASWSVILTFGQQVYILGKELVGLLPKLDLLAVFSSSDTVVGTHTVGHALL